MIAKLDFKNLTGLLEEARRRSKDFIESELQKTLNLIINATMRL